MSIAYSQPFSIRKVPAQPSSLPAFIPPPGFFGNIPAKGTGLGVTNNASDLTTPQSYGADGSIGGTGMFGGWGRRVFCKEYSQSGAVAVCSGDHAGSACAIFGVILFDLSSLTWKIVGLPAHGHTDGYLTAPPYGPEQGGLGQMGIQFGEWPDGTLSWGHPYGLTVYIPPADGATSKGEIAFANQAWGNWGKDTDQTTHAYLGGPNGPPWIPEYPHAIDLSVVYPEVLANPDSGMPGRGMRRGPRPNYCGDINYRPLPAAQVSSPGSTNNGATYDPIRKGWWSGLNGIIFVDSATLNPTKYADHSGTGVMLPTYCPPYDLIICISQSMFAFNPQAPTAPFTMLNVSNQSGITPAPGNVFPIGGFNLMQWSTILNCFVSINWNEKNEGQPTMNCTNGVAQVLKFSPPAGNPLTGTWTFTTDTMQGYDTIAHAPDATVNVDLSNVGNHNEWGNFMEVPAWRCFIRTGGINNPPQLFRLQGM